MLARDAVERRHGEIFLISEIIESADGKVGETVRVTGCLKTFDPRLNLGLLSYGGKDLLVDTTLLGIMDKHSPKSLLQLIGDLDDFQVDNPELASSPVTSNPPRHIGGGVVVLRARIVRNVDGLDLSLFEKAVKMRRSFAEQRRAFFDS